MTPEEETRFIALWQQGASYRALAQALGCALGTVGSRAAALVAQGKIQPRSRGGAYPRQQAQTRPEGTPARAPRPVQRPVQSLDTGAVHSADTGAVQPFDTGPVQRLNRLEDEVLGLRRLMQSVLDRLDHPPV